ncbi:hypothetical protein JG688_00016351 [Phytophthora aleatoria]|uniref:Uncharacterized protein n=1 Tax=Phytophthora aleatoria TaxID=2496075 RepID=A0A8J5IYC5_9STRA|nr:hypothetical protein JG688_00016351 [Phytophthora aleatoria]
MCTCSLSGSKDSLWWTCRVGLQQRPRRSRGPLDASFLVDSVWCGDHTRIDFVLELVPKDKTTKARCRKLMALASNSCILSTINKLLGSLWCVSTCFPVARAFFQNVQMLATTCTLHHVRCTGPQRRAKRFAAMVSRGVSTPEQV